MNSGAYQQAFRGLARAAGCEGTCQSRSLPSGVLPYFLQAWSQSARAEPVGCETHRTCRVGPQPRPPADCLLELAVVVVDAALLAVCPTDVQAPRRAKSYDGLPRLARGPAERCRILAT